MRSAMRTSSAAVRVFIFFIMLERWTLTVFSVIASCRRAALLPGAVATAQFVVGAGAGSVVVIGFHPITLGNAQCVQRTAQRIQNGLIRADGSGQKTFLKRFDALFRKADRGDWFRRPAAHSTVGDYA